jgi:hypothetical protein
MTDTTHANDTHADAHRFNINKFRSWCDRQKELSRSTTARIIIDDGETVRFRLREESGTPPEDIVFIRSENTDTIRFEKGDSVKSFHAHRRGVTFHEKTLIIRHKSGEAMYRAGTGTRNKRGPFPV